MTCFRVLLEGTDIDIVVGDQRICGFFVTRFVRATSVAAARVKAADLVDADWTTGKFRDQHTSPCLSIIEVVSVSFLTAAFSRQPGYVFHCDE